MLNFLRKVFYCLKMWYTVIGNAFIGLSQLSSDVAVK